MPHIRIVHISASIKLTTILTFMSIAMDETLRSECDRILNDPSVLEEEQTDQISNIIQKFYLQNGQSLAAADLDTLVLDTLWRHRRGNSNSQRPAHTFKAFSGHAGVGGSTVRRKKVIRNRFATPSIAVVHPELVRNGMDTGSSVPSTRSTSPDPFYSGSLHMSEYGYNTFRGHSESSIPLTSPSATSSPVLLFENGGSQDGFIGTPDISQNTSVTDLTQELGTFDPFNVTGIYHDDDDEDDIYRPLTQTQQQQLQQGQEVLQSLQLHHPRQPQQSISQYHEYNDGANFEAYNSQVVTDPTGSMQIAPSTASSASSPSTAASSFTVAANSALYSPAGAHIPLSSGAPVTSAMSETTSASDETASPFEHIRAALALPAAANLPDSAVIASLERNGYDISSTLSDLFGRLSGKSVSVTQNVKVQTIGPAYSLPTSALTGVSSKDQPKIPTVCRQSLN